MRPERTKKVQTGRGPERGLVAQRQGPPHPRSAEKEHSSATLAEVVPPPAGACLTSSVEQLRALLGRQQDEWEQDRTRLARELHVNLAQNLAVLAMELSLLVTQLCEPRERSQGQGLRDKLRELSALVERMIKWTRRMRAELRPLVLDEFGLGAALKSRGAQFEKETGLRCDSTAVREDLVVDLRLATGLFRLFEAILANVRRHAGASRVESRLEAKAGKLVLEVSDNGRGIAEAPVAGVRSLGLVGMREQARRLGGELWIRGDVGKGTSVSLTSPAESPKGPKIGLFCEKCSKYFFDIMLD